MRQCWIGNRFTMPVFTHLPLRTHKIASLSAHFGLTIHSVWTEVDLRAVFYQNGASIVILDIGNHPIYR